MEEAADHARRPHVHLGAAHEHHHGASAHSHPSVASHAGPGVSSKKLMCVAGVEHEHDADAFYFASGLSLDRNRSASGSGQANDELAAQCSGWIAPPLWNMGCDDQRFHPPPDIGRSACALYLLHLSIRC